MKSLLRFMDWPLRAKMAALLLVASLLPLVIAAIIDIQSARERLLANTAALLSARGDHLADQLDAFHRNYQRSVDRFARLPGTVEFFQTAPEGLARLVPSMRSMMEVWPASDPDIRGVAMLDVSGTVRLATEDRLIGVDLSYRSFVREALRGTGAIVSDIYFADRVVNQVPTIAYLAPVRGPDRRTIGMTAFWVRATALWKVMKASNELAGPGSFAVLFDRHGIRIAHTYSDDIVFHPGGRLDPATLEALVAEHRFGENTRTLLEDVRAFPEQYDRAREESPDKGVFRGFAPVNQKWNFGVGRRFATVPWTVFYMIPEESFGAQIAQTTRQKTLFAAVIILFAAVAGTLFVAVILRPIGFLSKTTAAIAAGDLTARVTVTHDDELGRLGMSFNTMAARIERQATALQKARDHLELKVLERTTELERTAMNLEAENAERKQAERAVRKSQQLLEAIIDNSAAVVYVKDLKGSYLLVNRRYEEIFHLTREAILGHSDYDLFPREAAEAFRAVDQRVAAGGTALTEEEVAPHDDGPHTYVSVKCPLRDSDGKIYGVFGISTDITERKRVEQAVRESEVRYRTLFDTMIEGFCTIEMIFDVDGKPVDYRFLEINPAFEKQTGLHNAQGRLMRDLAPDHEAHWFEIYGSIALSGEPLHFENEARALGRHYDVCAYRVGGPESRKVGILFNDITERKVAEGKAHAQLARLELLNRVTRAIAERQDLRSIFQVVIRSVEESLPVDFSCVCLYEPTDNVVTITSVGGGSAALAMELAMTEHARIAIDENGLSRCVRGQLVYEPDVSQVPFPFPQRLARSGLRALVAAPLLVESRVFGLLIAARRKPQSFSSGECEFLRQASEHVALASHQAQLYGALQQAYDDLRQTQQAILQQERLRALGQMASGIAHDINNAISPAALYAESLLEKEPHLTARGREQLGIVQHALEDVAQTVARMREFYRQREPQLTLSPINPNRLVQQVIDLTRARWSDMPQLRGTVIELAVVLPSEMPAIMGVESEIREALINLVFNAVDAMPNGGTLTLRTRIAETLLPIDDTPVRRVHIDVSDTGVGMDEDTRRRCMEPFFTTKGERGTGLGLAMVYGMVQRHSADLEIESALGRGTTMSLSFAVPTVTPMASAPSAALVMLPRLRLLVVDDDPLLIRSLRDTLEADGHVIVTATDGQSGIDTFRGAYARGERFDVVITDLGMPHIDGRKVASAVKSISAVTPVILLTGWGQRLVAEGDVPAYVDRVLAKPPKLRDLREALAHCCRGKAN